jgi:hypothetical protein
MATPLGAGLRLHRAKGRLHPHGSSSPSHSPHQPIGEAYGREGAKKQAPPAPKGKSTGLPTPTLAKGPCLTASSPLFSPTPSPLFPSYPCGAKNRGRRKSLVESELRGGFLCYPSFLEFLGGKKKKREGERRRKRPPRLATHHTHLPDFPRLAKGEGRFCRPTWPTGDFGHTGGLRTGRGLFACKGCLAAGARATQAPLGDPLRPTPPLRRPTPHRLADWPHPPLRAGGG